MLVLTRRTGERIVIGGGDDQITITVIEARPDRVRLGVDAPRELRVDRSEVRDRLDAERAADPIAAYDLGDPGA